MTSKFIQDILSEMENEILNNGEQQVDLDDDEAVEEGAVDPQVLIKARELISKYVQLHRRAMNSGDREKASRISNNMKDTLEQLGYNWRQDPYALEIMDESVDENIDEAEHIDRKLASMGRGEQAQAQLNKVWARAVNNAHGDITLMSDEELGAAIKNALNDNAKNQIMGLLAQKTKGLELEPMAGTRDAGTFMRQKHNVLKNSKQYGKLNIMRESFIKELRVLLENEVEQAEVLMASKGFSEELQVMIEKLGRLMNEKLPPVIDQMRLAYGTEQADVFGETMRSDMQSILDTLLAVRENIDHAVVSISQGKMPHEESDMDADGDLANTGTEMDVEPSSDLQNELGDLADEFGGDEGMSGPEEDPLGRAKKESFDDLRNQLLEMRKKIDSVKK